MPIFRVKSVKIYTGQKKFTRTPSACPWQISGMTICLSGNSVSANKVQQWNPQKEESTFLCVNVTSFQPGAQCPKEVEVTQSADIIDWPTWGRGVDAYFLFSDDSVSQDFAFYILLVIFYLVLIIIQFECILDSSRSLSYFVPQVPKSSWLE